MFLLNVLGVLLGSIAATNIGYIAVEDHSAFAAIWTGVLLACAILNAASLVTSTIKDYMNEAVAKSSQTTTTES